MNTKFKTEAKNDFEKDFFKLMNNAVFAKTMENIRNHRHIKLKTTDKKIRLVSEPNYHTKMAFLKFISNRNEKYKSKNEYTNISIFFQY